MTDDELDERLRALFRAGHPPLVPRPDMLEVIHRGARRRQARRAGALAAAGVVAVALATTAVVRPFAPARQTAGTHAQTAAAVQPSRLVASPTLQATETSAPAVAATSAEAGTVPAGGTPPAGFVPLSVTGTTSNGQTFWVLGDAPCATGTCTAVAKTTDGGQSFTEMAAPASAVVPDHLLGMDGVSPQTIANMRFVDAKNGWAFGGALWQTTDGAQSWQQITSITGTVQQLEVASGHAWAIVATGGGSPPGATGTARLFTATYPAGTWGPVDAAGVFGPVEPALVVHDTTVIVAGVDPTTGTPRAVRSTDAATFAELPAPPCAPAPTGGLSITASALWLLCADHARAYVSTDAGTSWRQVGSTLPADAAVVAAIDPTTAVIAHGGRLIRIGTDGTMQTAATPSGASGFAFVGFVNDTVGFAIAEVANSRQLWRSTDAGAHWSLVRIGG